MENLRAVIEALLFASDIPLSPDKIGEILGGADRATILETIRDIEGEYEKRPGGIILEEAAGGFQFRTRTELGEWVRKMKGIKPALLSQAALETLAIVAYRQPLTRAEIEKVRGVDVGGVLKNLLERKLVRILGRKNVPGKPMIYGTTKKFLEVFSLNDLSDLPTLREMTELQE